ncbi:hypothetical protein [Pleionea sp. CnH1-48]|uniref:hypothetical protein n=1 Tax=Pleionea sp. CnH1-48 TaxID=2954494 RepID=UPI0020979135|nr:hypothetical protein [Pleionea sp. CnH1-48]MCO7224588.1 hypothetical protein [Pleionea sp. CnH1-48]
MTRTFNNWILVSLTFAFCFAWAETPNPQSKGYLQSGSGTFNYIRSNAGDQKVIPIHYYRPNNFNADSRVIMVIPGAGRNAWSYRDAWIEASERYNLLVLSPHYSEQDFPRFWSYNLAGMITDVTIDRKKMAISHFKLVNQAVSWLYQDFDAIFHQVKQKVSLSATHYDMFGHSAGGQILHRMALFHPNNKAHRILASNSGWYTTANFSQAFPYGLKNAPLSESDLPLILKQKLILFLGEKDNANETRGHLVHNVMLDQQGTHRLARGKHFFKKAKQLAQKKSLKHQWKIHIVPNVGHDYRKMSAAAANYLYGSETDRL